jgi:hypothetical protein
MCVEVCGGRGVEVVCAAKGARLRRAITMRAPGEMGVKEVCGWRGVQLSSKMLDRARKACVEGVGWWREGCGGGSAWGVSVGAPSFTPATPPPPPPHPTPNDCVLYLRSSTTSVGAFQGSIAATASAARLIPMP